MEGYQFEMGKLIGKTFSIITKFPKYFLLPILLEVALYVVNIYLTYQVPLFKELSLVKIVYSFIYLTGTFFLTFIILVGFIRMIKNWTIQAIEPTWKDFFSWNFSIFWKYLFLSLIVAILAMVGLIFIIVPGMIIISNYLLAPYLLIDSGFDFSKAMETSKELIKPFKWTIFWFVLLYLFVFFVPATYLSYHYYIFHKDSTFIGMLLLGSISLTITQLSKIFLAFLYFDLTPEDKTGTELLTSKIP